MIRTIALLAVLVLAGCSNCGGKQATNNIVADAGSNEDVRADATPANNGLNFERRIPLEDLTQNRLEDPNFGFQSEAWFAVDNDNELQRVRRIYQPHSPGNRPVAGIVGGNGRTCLLGRMLWGSGNHAAEVFVSAATEDAEVDVNLLGIDPTAPTWMTAALEPAESGGFDEHGDKRTWRRYEGIVAGRFGWGYFEVCADSTETVFVGAPSVNQVNTANTLLSPTQSGPAKREQLRRIDAFDRWRTR